MKRILCLCISLLLIGVSDIQAQTTTKCTNCNGVGYTAICQMCGGGGAIFDGFFGWMPCPYCGASGKIVCFMCCGTGYVVMQAPPPAITAPPTQVPPITQTPPPTQTTSHTHTTYESVYVDVNCPHCHGSGKCQTCNGKGVYLSIGDWLKCPNCYGGNQSGKCQWCQGTGKVKDRQDVIKTW